MQNKCDEIDCLKGENRELKYKIQQMKEEHENLVNMVAQIPELKDKVRYMEGQVEAFKFCLKQLGQRKAK